MRKQEKKIHNVIIEIMKRHVVNNKKQYIIVGIIFLIGLVIGVNFVNNISDDSKQNMNTYLNDFIVSLKENYQIDRVELIKTSITNYLITALVIWFMGSTVIGIPIVYLIVGIKGFTLGYTISCIMISLGFGKGLLFNLLALFLQNIIVIPSILALAVSGIRLYKSIMKDKRKENIKVEIIRHTMFSLFVTGLLFIATFIEVYISSNLISVGARYM